MTDRQQFTGGYSTYRGPTESERGESGRQTMGTEGAVKHIRHSLSALQLANLSLASRGI